MIPAGVADMGHSHAEDQQTYYLDQLCTLGICGALGVIMILMRTYEVLPLILHPKFHDAVVWGGYALLGMVAIRGVVNLLVDAVDHKADYKDMETVQKYLVSEAGAAVRISKYDEKAGNMYMILLDHQVY